MGKQPSFQWYPKDCETDERAVALSNEEFGFYMRCLSYAWTNNGLPSDTATLGRLTRNFDPRSTQRLWKVVAKFFELRGDRYINEKQEEQRQEQLRYSESQRERGKRSAMVRRLLNHGSTSVQPARVNSASATATATAITPCTPLYPEAAANAFEQLQKLWKKPGPPVLSQQCLCGLVEEGTDLSLVVGGLAAWSEWWESTGDSGGWRYCKQNLPEALHDRLWETPPPKTTAQKKREHEEELDALDRKDEEERNARTKNS
jgi:uncharacterized protein YdaU (DUF1376 family)